MAREATTSPAGRDWIRHCLCKRPGTTQKHFVKQEAGPLEVPELLQAVPLFVPVLSSLYLCMVGTFTCTSFCETAATGATRPWQQQAAPKYHEVPLSCPCNRR